MDKKWYQLGGNASIFWDPTQSDPENQQLLIGQARQLDLTPKVGEWKRNGGLVEISEVDATALNAKFDAKNKDSKALISEKAKANAKADQILEKAAALEQEGKTALAEATVKHEAAEKILGENDLLKQQVDELKTKLDLATKPGK